MAAKDGRPLDDLLEEIRTVTNGEFARDKMGYVFSQKEDGECDILIVTFYPLRETPMRVIWEMVGSRVVALWPFDCVGGTTDEDIVSMFPQWLSTALQIFSARKVILLGDAFDWQNKRLLEHWPIEEHPEYVAWPNKYASQVSDAGNITFKNDWNRVVENVKLETFVVDPILLQEQPEKKEETTHPIVTKSVKMTKFFKRTASTVIPTDHKEKKSKKSTDGPLDKFVTSSSLE
jgi:hypothetical protein